MASSPQIHVGPRGYTPAPPTYINSGPSIEDMKKRVELFTPRSFVTHAAPAPAPAPNVRKQLFDGLVDAKILTSRLAMYMTRHFRDQIFRQLDNLFDPENWDEDDQLLKQKSYLTFVRVMVELKPPTRPGLGLADNGNLLAIWSKEGSRLSLEFQPEDRIRWTVSVENDGERDVASGTSTVTRLEGVLTAFGGQECLMHGAK